MHRGRSKGLWLRVWCWPVDLHYEDRDRGQTAVRLITAMQVLESQPLLLRGRGGECSPLLVRRRLRLPFFSLVDIEQRLQIPLHPRELLKGGDENWGTNQAAAEADGEAVAVGAAEAALQGRHGLAEQKQLYRPLLLPVVLEGLAGMGPGPELVLAARQRQRGCHYVQTQGNWCRFCALEATL